MCDLQWTGAESRIEMIYQLVNEAEAKEEQVLRKKLKREKLFEEMTDCLWIEA